MFESSIATSAPALNLEFVSSYTHDAASQGSCSGIVWIRLLKLENGLNVEPEGHGPESDQ